MMSNRDKSNTAESAAPATLPISEEIHDPPPPYTPYETSTRSKPPPLPTLPPVVTQEPHSATRPRIIGSPDDQTTDYTCQQVWEGCKAICCFALCWSWAKCVFGFERCVQMCPDRKSRRNR